MSWPEMGNSEFKPRMVAIAEAQERSLARLCAATDRIADSLAQIQARTEAIFALLAGPAAKPQIPPKLFRETGNRRNWGARKRAPVGPTEPTQGGFPEQLAADRAAYRRACRRAEENTSAGPRERPEPLTDAEQLALGISIREELERQGRLEVNNE